MQPKLFAGASTAEWPGGLLMDLELPVSIRFGRARVSLAEALDLSAGSVLELDSRVDDPVEVVVNNKVVARGYLMVVDGYYGIEIVSVPGSRNAFAPDHRAAETQDLPSGSGSQEPGSCSFPIATDGTEVP